MGRPYHCTGYKEILIPFSPCLLQFFGLENLYTPRTLQKYVYKLEHNLWSHHFHMNLADMAGSSVTFLLPYSLAYSDGSTS